MFDNVKDILSRKVYGIPVIFLAVIAVGAMVWYLNRTASEDVAAEETSDGETTDDTEGDTALYDVASFTAAASEADTDDDDVAETNESWRKSAYTYLTSTKGNSPIAVEAALTAYLNGDVLTAQQAAMVDMAILYLGRPPAGPSSPSSVTASTSIATRQGTPPTNHTVKGTTDNSLAKLSRLYWSQSTPDTVDQLVAANGSLPSPRGTLAVGTVVRIPKRTNPKFTKVTAKYRTLPQIAKRAGISQATIQNLNPGVATASNLPIGKRIQIA